MRAEVFPFTHAVLLHQDEGGEEDRLEIDQNTEEHERIAVELGSPGDGIPKHPAAEYQDVDGHKGGGSAKSADGVGDAIREGPAVGELLLHFADRLDILADRIASAFGACHI